MMRWLLCCALLSGCSLAVPAPRPVTPVHVLGPEGEGVIHVVFLGSGFTEDQLGTYRKVVELLARGLVDPTLGPLARYASNLSFHRIDLVGEGGGVKNLCNTSFRSVTEFDIEGGEVHRTRSAESKLELEAQVCWNASNLKILYVDTRKRAVEIIDPTFPVQIVAIIANLNHDAGGAQVQAAKGQVSVVAAGVPLEVGTQLGMQRVGSKAIALLAHEIGHGLGLYDEYDHLQGLQPPTLYPGRNIWHPSRRARWDLSSTSSPPWSADEVAIPWQSRLVEGCTPQSMNHCRGDGEQCALVGISEEQASCSSVPKDSNPAPGGCFPPRSCDQAPGAWEGGYYLDEGYYRARERCLMRHIDTSARFCDACERYLDDYFRQ